MHRNLQRGLTLIELAIVIALAGILMAMAMPALQDWIANSRVRSAAESVLNGLQLARAEAVRRNTLVNMYIRSDGIEWDVVVDGYRVQTSGPPSGSSVTSTLVGATAATFKETDPAIVPTAADINLVGATEIAFNGQGRMVAPATFATRYSSSVSGARAMCTAIVANTPKLCDPQRTDTTDPQGCLQNAIVC